MNGHTFPHIMHAWFPWTVPDAFEDGVQYDTVLMAEQNGPVFSRRIPDNYKGTYVKVT